MAEYVHVLHVYTNSENDLAAIDEADNIKLAIERDLLDTQDGEGVDVVQTIPLGEDPVPSASIMQLRRARNILLRTKRKDAYDVARSLDQVAYQLSSGDPLLTSYDWGKFVEVMREILDGKNPLEY